MWYDFVRPGLLLYGVVPPPLATTIGLRPALSLHSRIVAVKGIRPGEGTGYGIKTTVTEPRTIAVVPAGYADGLDLASAKVGIGLSCRLCDRPDCRSRAFPPLEHRLLLDPATAGAPFVFSRPGRPEMWVAQYRGTII